MKDYIRENRKSLYLIGMFFVLGALFRFTAVYPVSCRGDSLKNVIQIGQIMRDSYYPMFFSGQAWMGISGSYILLLLIKIFGCNDFVFAFFGFLNSILWYFLAILLGHRFFGIKTAVLLAFFGIVPTMKIMHWVPAARPDYQVAFLMVPVVLMSAHFVLTKIKHKQNLKKGFFFLGFFTGFAFWTNMGTGPAGIASLVCVFLYDWRKFFKNLPFYVLGGVLGFSPVIYYNLTEEFIFFRQTSTFENISNLGMVMKLFFKNAFPFFFGVDINQTHSVFYTLVSYVFYGWFFLVYILGFAKFIKAFKEKKYIGHGVLLFSYLGLHMFIASASNFGSRYANLNYPTAYLTVLHGVIFAIPAFVIAECKNKIKKTVLVIPVIFYLANNIYVNIETYNRFFSTVKNKGFSEVRHYPDTTDELLVWAKENNLKYGYGIGADAERMNLYGFGEIFVADFYQEKYLSYSLQADSSFKLFWTSPPFDNLKHLGCTYLSENLAGIEVAYKFSKDTWYKKRHIPTSIRVSENRLEENFLTDRSISTGWSLPADKKVGVIEIEFDEEIRLSELVIFPAENFSLGTKLKIEISKDKEKWETISVINKPAAIFYSVFHPFLKIVKPRMEIVLGENKAKYYRIVCENASKEFRRNPFFKEIYFYTYLQKEKEVSYRESVSNVIRFVLEKGKGKVIAGDHFFESFFAKQGFKTEFISNRFINNTGIKNPHINESISVDLENSLVVLSSGNIEASKEFLKENGVSFKENKFGVFSVLEILEHKKNQRLSKLYFTGIDFVELFSEENKSVLKYPQLKNLFPSVVYVEYNFAEEFLLTEYVVNKLNKRQVEILFGVNAFSEKEKRAYLFVHLCDKDNNVVAQGDMELRDQLGPFYKWGKEKHILKTMINIPVELKGDFVIKIGIWYPEEGRRVELKSTGQDIITLSKINF